MWSHLISKNYFVKEFFSEFGKGLYQIANSVVTLYNKKEGVKGDFIFYTSCIWFLKFNSS